MGEHVVMTLLGSEALDADGELLGRLRSGDEDAFVALVDHYQPSMLRLAWSMVGSRAVAEEVVQDTWMGVVRGIERFEGRSSLKTWLFRILVNRARSSVSRELHNAPFESARTVDPARFDADGHWADPVDQWAEEVDARLDSSALTQVVADALQGLPPRQRQVVLLRDVEGLSSEEACQVLGLTQGNQRILLHRARARLRQEVETELWRSQRC